MYPDRTPVVQFETRQQELERELRSNRESDRARRERSLARTPVGPPRYKLALLTWVAAYALITLVLALLGPAMASWPLILRTLVVSVTMVVTLTWLVMPCFTRVCRGWLSPSA
jgi:antibiotic biosynthesis monooxygenase (ABM) superfamily enzyme